MDGTDAPARARHGSGARRSPGHLGAEDARGSDARVLPVLRVRTAARRAGRRLRAARHRHRDAARGRLHRSRSVRRRASRAAGRAGRASRRGRHADSGVLLAQRRTGRPRRARGAQRPRSLMLSYLPIYIAAILEGEVYYSKVCADAVSGRLNWVLVLLAGALGGSTGDQLWFYILRGRLHWLDRYPRLRKYHDRVIAHVHAHETGIVLLSRFLPGL